MKKIYLSVVALGVALSSMAQVGPVQTQQVKMRATMPVGMELPGVTPSSAAAAAGDTLWSDDFSTPGNWTLTNNSSPAYDFEFVSALPANLSGFGTTLESATNDQFLLANSDGEGDGNNQECYAEFATPIDLSGYSNVNIVWTQYAADFFDENFVEVSTDGGTTWTSFEVNAEVAPNDATDNPDYVQVNISSAVAANPSNVTIRFKYTAAWGYFWAIDDVAITEGVSNDLGVDDVWHGDIVNAWEYKEIPLAQAQSVVVGAASSNLGANAQTNAMYGYSIILAGDTVDSGMFAANNDSIVSTDGDTTWFDTEYTPMAVGTYEVHVYVSSDSADANAANDMGMSVFNVSENVYGHDDINNITVQTGGGNDANDDMNEYKVGMVYEVFEATTLYSVQTAFGSSTTTSSCIVELYDYENNPNLDDPLETVVYDIDAANDISGGSTLVLVDILINGAQGVDLDPGTYMVVVGNTGVGEDLTLLASNGDDDFGQLRYGPYGAGGAIDWYIGWTTSPIVRMNFDETVDVQENEDVSAVSVYPNPAVDNITVGFTSKDNQDLTVNVFGIDGALLMSNQLKAQAGQNSRVTFDVENLASGMYLVQIQGAQSSLTKRVVVK